MPIWFAYIFAKKKESNVNYINIVIESIVTVNIPILICCYLSIQVKVWFQNRRTKFKKDKERQSQNSNSFAESLATKSVLKMLECKPPAPLDCVRVSLTLTPSLHNSAPIESRHHKKSSLISSSLTHTTLCRDNYRQGGNGLNRLEDTQTSSSEPITTTTYANILSRAINESQTHPQTNPGQLQLQENTNTNIPVSDPKSGIAPISLYEPRAVHLRKQNDSAFLHSSQSFESFNRNQLLLNPCTKSAITTSNPLPAGLPMQYNRFPACSPLSLSHSVGRRFFYGPTSVASQYGDNYLTTQQTAPGGILQTYPAYQHCQSTDYSVTNLRF